MQSPIAPFLAPLMKVTDAAPAGMATAPGTLPFSMQTQEHSLWCWAAVAASVSTYLHESTHVDVKSQCEIATESLGIPCCPPLPADWDGNRTWGLDDAFQKAGHYEAGPLALDDIDDASLFAQISAHIANNKPVGCHIDEADVSGHYVAIIGCYDDDDQDLVVRDPLPTPHNGTFPFKEFKTFNGGTWDFYYFTV